MSDYVVMDFIDTNVSTWLYDLRRGNIPVDGVITLCVIGIVLCALYLVISIMKTLFQLCRGHHLARPTSIVARVAGYLLGILPLTSVMNVPFKASAQISSGESGRVDVPNSQSGDISTSPGKIGMETVFVSVAASAGTTLLLQLRRRRLGFLPSSLPGLLPDLLPDLLAGGHPDLLAGGAELSVDELIVPELGGLESRPSDPAILERVLPSFLFIAAVLGSPQILHRSGARVRFERSRSEELVLWLALHPTQQRRSSARTEMWIRPVKDATFSNVTHDVRRSMTAAQRSMGDPWLGITMTDELPLRREIVSDIDLLRACLNHARRWPEDGGIEVLQYGLGLVRGAPFAGCPYIWCDSTGLSTDAAMLIVRCALLLADLLLADLLLAGLPGADLPGAGSQQITDLIYWATGQGLLAVPCHEDLVMTRLRLHAAVGDTASLHHEWSGYHKALANDDWGPTEPSPKMLQVWDELSNTKVA